MPIKKILNLIIKNLHLKIISFILASIVFLAVHSYNNNEVIQNIDVHISLSIPQNYMIINKIPGKVSFLVKGSVSEIEELKKQNINLNIKIKGSKTILLSDYTVPKLEKMKIIQIIPKTLDIVIEKVMEKKVPIQFNVINELPAGYKYEKKPSLNKKYVTVIGPQSSVELLKKVYSEPLNQASIIGSESKILKLKLESPLIKFKDMREVSVSYKITEEYITKEMKELNINFLNCEMDKYNIIPLKDKVKLIVNMPYSLKNKFQPVDFLVYADLRNCEKFEYLTSIKLSVALPHKKITVKYLIPDTVILKKLKQKNKIKKEK